MDALVPQIEALARDADEHGRKQLIDRLHDLAISLEQPQDVAQRLLFSQIPLAAVHIGCDLKLFDQLSKTGQPTTLDELESSTGVQPKLIARLLRYMASVRLVQEVDTNTFEVCCQQRHQNFRNFRICGWCLSHVRLRRTRPQSFA